VIHSGEESIPTAQIRNIQSAACADLALHSIQIFSRFALTTKNDSQTLCLDRASAMKSTLALAASNPDRDATLPKEMFRPLSRDTE
jgi:hypothetical protein